MTSPLLQEVMTEFAEELQALLAKDDKAELAHQVSSLLIIDRCRCDEVGCTTFYTAPRPEGAWGLGHESIVLDPNEGWLVLDVLNGKIVCVEILNRRDLNGELLKCCP